ncbi:HAD-IA family hydrolase [uncultured Kiloniella sp.]|uniref:HAD-IA family hydrolase n=1 Tax=uncultured Kiloniella sp. TaxID=1133091 RepID=UPI0026213EFD|nr:HAD-IA family hydrolase [uncultured Kiloniella sp.]
MTKRNVLVFDLDGTLIESAPDLALSLQILLKSEGRREPDLMEVKSMIGDGATKLVERGYAATGSALSEQELKEKVKKFLEIYSDNLIVETHLYDNCRTVLESLKAQGWKLLICTNKPIAPTIEIMNEFNLHNIFDKAVGGDSYSVKKPDPAHVLNLLNESGVSAAQAIMIGDGVNDVLVAKNAGIPSILFTHGYGTEAAKAQNPDVIIDAFSELEDAINRLA